MKAGLIVFLRALRGVVKHPFHYAALSTLLPAAALVCEFWQIDLPGGSALSTAHWLALLALVTGGLLPDMRAPTIGSIAALVLLARAAQNESLDPLATAMWAAAVVGLVVLQSRARYRSGLQHREMQQLEERIAKIATLEFHSDTSDESDAAAGLAGQLKSSSAKLAALFGDLGGAHAYISEMNARLENSARVFIESTENQNGALQESTGAVQEVLGAVAEIKNSVNFAVTSAAEIQTTAGVLLESVTGIQSAMREFADLSQSLGDRTATASHTIQSTIEAMESIQDSSARIGSILDTITDISDQTNLLALNASIEAARAGDAGRGFAVVADHISRLADRTNSSVQDIGRLTEETRAAVTRGGAEVRELNVAIQNTVTGTSGIQESAASVMQGLAEQLDRIRSINDSLQKFDDHSTFVQSVANEQEKSVQLLNEKMVNLMLEIQNVASGSQDLMTISQEMGRWSGHIQEALGRVRTQ